MRRYRAHVALLIAGLLLGSIVSAPAAPTVKGGSSSFFPGQVNYNSICLDTTNKDIGLARSAAGIIKATDCATTLKAMQATHIGAGSGVDFDIGELPSGPAWRVRVTGTRALVSLTDNNDDIGASGANRPRTVFVGTAVNSPTYLTTTRCANTGSPAVCAAAPAGSVVIAAAATAVVVNTTAVTANSQVFAMIDRGLGTLLSVTCDTTSDLTTGSPAITARTATTSFTIAVPVAPAANPLCLSYFIVN